MTPVESAGALVPIDTAAMSEECTRLIEAVPGVAAVYRADPLAAAVVKTVAEAVRRESARPRFVRVTSGEDGLGVVAVIGIDGSEPAGVVCRRVHAALSAHLGQRPETVHAHVRVKIGRIV